MDAIRPAVATPPRKPFRSISRTSASFLAAATAAATPEMPPPATITSTSSATGVFLSGSAITFVQTASRIPSRKS